MCIIGKEEQEEEEVTHLCRWAHLPCIHDCIHTCSCWPGYRHTREVLPAYTWRLYDKYQVYRVYTASDLY